MDRFESLVNSDRYKTNALVCHLEDSLRALLIQIGTKHVIDGNKLMGGLRALLIQIGTKQNEAGRRRRDSLRALLIQIGTKPKQAP